MFELRRPLLAPGSWGRCNPTARISCTPSKSLSVPAQAEASAIAPGFFSWKMEPLGVRSHFGTGGGPPNTPTSITNRYNTQPRLRSETPLWNCFPGTSVQRAAIVSTTSIYRRRRATLLPHTAPVARRFVERLCLSVAHCFCPMGEPLVFGSVKSVSPVILPNSHSAPPRAGLFFRAPANNPT